MSYSKDFPANKIPPDNRAELTRQALATVPDFGKKAQQDLNEQLRLCAEADGWTFRNNGNTAELFIDGEFIRGCHEWAAVDYFDYHKNIATLWYLAKRVKDEILALPVSEWVDAGHRCHENINIALTNQDIPALFAATVSGIKLLREYKTPANDGN